jgi:hypothetical protein
LGQTQALAYPIEQTYVVPDEQNPQTFKEKLLREHFTPEELAARDAFIRALSQMLAAAGS